jgi:hypothetical protein
MDVCHQNWKQLCAAASVVRMWTCVFKSFYMIKPAASGGGGFKYSDGTQQTFSRLRSFQPEAIQLLPQIRSVILDVCKC